MAVIECQPPAGWGLVGNWPPIEERFQEKFIPVTESGCWLWVGGGWKNHGYGMFKIKQGRYLAHRVSWELYRGSIPDGINVCHICDVACCVNPSHLFLGTNAENMKDRDAKGRGKKPPLHFGESHPRAKLSLVQVAAIRSSSDPTRKIATRFGISQSQACAIKNGSSWK
jgi:hypothetical protein